MSHVFVWTIKDIIGLIFLSGFLLTILFCFVMFCIDHLSNGGKKR